MKYLLNQKNNQLVGKCFTFLRAQGKPGLHFLLGLLQRKDFTLLSTQSLGSIEQMLDPLLHLELYFNSLGLNVNKCENSGKFHQI